MKEGRKEEGKREGRKEGRMAIQEAKMKEEENKDIKKGETGRSKIEEKRKTTKGRERVNIRY